MTASKRTIGSDLAKVDAYVNTPADYDELPDMSDRDPSDGVFQAKGVPVNGSAANRRHFEEEAREAVMLYNPRHFFDEFVEPTMQEWLLDRMNIRKAVIACCQIDSLAEHMIMNADPSLDRRGVTANRNILGKSNWFLGIIRDIHDTHKHGHLTRKSALIRDPRRPEKETFGGAVASGPIGGSPLGGSMENLVVIEDVVIEDKRRRHNLEHVLIESVRYWSTQMNVLGL